MTMTMTTQDYTDDEEKFLIDKLLSARHALKLHKEESSARKFKQNQLEKELKDIEQACISYMAGNGLKETSGLSISETYSVDVSDIESVPEKYIRTKITMEVNKALIRAENLPPGNWPSYSTGYKLTYKGVN